MINYHSVERNEKNAFFLWTKKSKNRIQKKIELAYFVSSFVEQGAELKLNVSMRPEPPPRNLYYYKKCYMQCFEYFSIMFIMDS